MDVGIFRQIHFWPLSVHLPDANDDSDLVARVTKHLTQGDGPWQPKQHPFEPGHTAKPEDYAAAVYMHPFLQKLLYPQEEKPALTRFEAKSKPDLLTVSLSAESSVKLNVNRLDLILFRTGVIILVLDLQNIEPLALETVQYCLDRLRRCYVPYWKDGSPKMVPASVTIDAQEPLTAPNGMVRSGLTNTRAGLAPDLLPWWEKLLAPLTFQENKQTPWVSHVVDERLPSMAFITVKDPTAIGRADWVRLCFADAPDKDLPYGREFLAEFEKHHCYDRFWDPEGPSWMRSRYLLSGYQFTFVGASGDFAETDLQTHFSHHYADMALVLYYQQAVLLRLMARLTPGTVSDLSDATYRAQLRAAQREWMDFLGHGWFPTLSNQVQGQDLFDRWQSQLRLPELYQHVADKARDMTAILNVAEDHEATEASLRLNWIAMLGLIASLIVGGLGVNVFIPDHAEGVKGWAVVAITTGVILLFAALGFGAMARLNLTSQKPPLKRLSVVSLIFGGLALTAGWI